MPHRLTSREWWTPVAIGFLVLFLAGCGVLVYAVSEFQHQQHQTDLLLQRTANIAAETCQSQKALRSVLTAVAISQPNVDPRVVHVLETVLDTLPKDCVP